MQPAPLRQVTVAITLGLLAACGACGGDDGETVDGRIDGPPPVDARIDANTGCVSGELFFTGELVDWDWTLANPMGIFDATFTVQGMPSRTDTTAPNGRFELCIPTGRVVVDIDAPEPYVDGIVVIDPDQITSGQIVSLRTFTATRAASFYAERSLPAYDADDAHLLVLELVDRVGVAFDGTADGPPQAGNDDDGDGALTWTADDTGRVVLFPNVEVPPATGVVTVGAAPHTAALAADTLTYVVTTTVL